jgi:hypothetical protein
MKNQREEVAAVSALNRPDSAMDTWSTARALTVAGLVVGAAGIAIMWASGVEFPVAIPPGMVILAIGALLVALGRWWWIPAVGAAFGLFVTVGFLLSPTGVDNLVGESGTAVALGQGIQQLGVITAFVAGLIATGLAYRRRSSVAQRDLG